MVQHHKRVVSKGKAFLERREITREDCERMVIFRTGKIESIDKQMARLEEDRRKQVESLSIEEATIEAIDSKGDFTES